MPTTSVCEMSQIPIISEHELTKQPISLGNIKTQHHTFSENKMPQMISKNKMASPLILKTIVSELKENKSVKESGYVVKFPVEEEN